MASIRLNEETGLYQVRGAVSADEILTWAENVLWARVAQEDALTSPDASSQYLRMRFANRPAEVFAVLWLDNRNRPLSLDELFQGTIDGASVYAREVVRAAIKHNAAAAIMVHNHPSGDPEPSQADVRITKRLKDALALIDVRVLDHIVVGRQGTVSLAERGLL